MSRLIEVKFYGRHSIDPRVTSPADEPACCYFVRYRFPGNPWVIVQAPSLLECRLLIDNLIARRSPRRKGR